MSITETIERKKPRPRRSSTTEFKAEVVELVRQPGKTAGSVARELGLTETAVRAWAKQADIDAGWRSDGPANEQLAEMAQLRKELREAARSGHLEKAGSGFLRTGDPVSAYAFIAAERAESRNVAKACELMEVSRFAFYDWQRHQPTRGEIDDRELGERIARDPPSWLRMGGCLTSAPP